MGNSALSVVMGHIGAGVVAANSVTNVTSHISTILVMGFATAASSVVGNTVLKSVLCLAPFFEKWIHWIAE